MNKIAFVDVDPKFVLEVASGIVEPAELAEKYGYTPSEWLFLQEYEPFVKQVNAKKEELRASGYTFRMKSAVLAEDLLQDVYVKAKAEDASFHTQLETLKFLARAAGLETPAKEQVQTGPGFSITINLGNGQSVQIGSQQTTTTGVVDVTPEDELDYDFSMAFPAYQPVPLTAEDDR